MMSPSITARVREINIERIVGRMVVDVDGARAGRIEEMLVAIRGTDFVIVELHLGSGAVLERIMNWAGSLRLVMFFDRFTTRRRRVPWDQIDLQDLEHPRLRVRADQLEMIEL
jgi:hypothetical protein